MDQSYINYGEKFLPQPRKYFNGENGIKSNGQFILSRPYNSKVATCFAGKFVNGFSNVLDQNPLSIINLSASTQDGYKLEEIEKKTPVSCIHLLNDKTMAIGHGKKVYIAQDNVNRLTYFINNFFAYPRSPRALSKVLELSPQLDLEDSITTIESSKSHLIVISEKGHISTWKKTNNIIQENTFQTFHHNSPFFSYAVSPEKNILCLGLKHGKIFVADIANLNKNIITYLLDDPTLKINCINFQNDKLFASALCECHYTTCCKQGFKPIVESSRKQVAGMDERYNGYVKEILAKHTQMYSNLPDYCNCHPQFWMTFKTIFLLSCLMKDQDVRRNIENFYNLLRPRNAAKNSHTCNNKCALLSFEEYNQNENTLPNIIIKEIPLSFSTLCPKKIKLLPNDLFVSHTAICSKNVSSYEEGQIKEIVQLHNDKIQDLLTIDTSCMGAVEYPIHAITTGNEIHTFGETKIKAFFNQMIYFHRMYTPRELSTSAKYATYTPLINYLAKQSYFSTTMHVLIPVSLLYAVSRYFSD